MMMILCVYTLDDLVWMMMILFGGASAGASVGTSFGASLSSFVGDSTIARHR
jgi:hypothetical protein